MENIADSPIHRIVWAVELFSVEGHFPLGSMCALEAISPAFGCEVEPVCVISSLEVPLGTPAKLRHWLARLSLPQLRPVHFLRHEGDTIRQAAKALADYARDTRADLIAVCTHGRSGLPRLIHGSFAETLLHLSPVPLLVSNPSVKLSGPLHQIIYPTDFSECSRYLFPIVLDLARALGASVRLFHTLDETTPPESPVSYWWAEQIFRDAEARAEEWKQLADDWEVELRYQIMTRYRPLAETLLEQAEREPGGLICVSCGSGQWRATVVGSTTHELMRHSRLPVLVMPLPAKEPSLSMAPEHAA
jgi:nucleotide-binding universal stress UspA family protein